MARIMGVDLGDVRTGVALSDPFEFMATGLCTITEYSEDRLLEKLAAIAEENSVKTAVFGLPVNMDGTEGFRAEKVRAFTERFAEMTGKAVVLEDERCTTVAAHSILNESLKKGSKKRKRVIDTLAAEIILQDYLARQKKSR